MLYLHEMQLAYQGIYHPSHELAVRDAGMLPFVHTQNLFSRLRGTGGQLYNHTTSHWSKIWHLIPQLD
jgi:hypothetical protein